ncbi:phasin family protein [Halonatronum saccharophilum]|uniref:phasin family protein n=1 Tax=Halonatronum saccharophilum TaxID=150060 RepID=UPI000482125D|nr:phasin family protein [Halonatronum saccharophilum]
MIKVFKEMMVTGLGALFFTKEKLEDIFDSLVEEGKVSREEANQLIDDMVQKAREEKKELGKKINSEVKSNLEKMGLVKAEEVEGLKDKVNELELYIKSLEQEIELLKKDGIEEVNDS